MAPTRKSRSGRGGVSSGSRSGQSANVTSVTITRLPHQFKGCRRCVHTTIDEPSHVSVMSKAGSGTGFKTMARHLRNAINDLKIEPTSSTCLNIVSKRAKRLFNAIKRDSRIKKNRALKKAGWEIVAEKLDALNGSIRLFIRAYLRGNHMIDPILHRELDSESVPDLF
ncbi:hypothetical protein AOQ84DRAFT_386386 [Glonium stellatum]|uniref:Uncharacterized protein n=1 Tax=Glonium stellatum TaxID=574774 RepID=A0A8E2F826_9PEZI|nr:hypothetical protein AOQ84DRAFT_386386 [Glonium stellatum]